MAENGTDKYASPQIAELDSRLDAIASKQRNILSALGMILDVLRAQGKMLQQLLALAREEPASSPLVESIDDLTNAILNMDRSVQTMSGQLGALPDAIAVELSQHGNGSVTHPGG